MGIEPEVWKVPQLLWLECEVPPSAPALEHLVTILQGSSGGLWKLHEVDHTGGR